jgi:hypothetical protein
MTSRLAVTLATLSFAGLPAAAAAEPPAVGTSTVPLPSPALRVDLGVASPVGAIGVVYTRPTSTWGSRLGLEAGVGIGLSGLQLSAMGKLRLGGDRWRFTPGLGIGLGVPLGPGSTFHEGHPDPDSDEHGPSVVMRWLDVDAVGIEYRGRGRLLFAASAGVTIALNHAHWDLGDIGSDINAGDPSPQLRLGLGRTF